MRRKHDPIKEGLEIADVAHLARLANAFFVGKTLQAEQLCRFVNGVIEPEIDKQAHESGAGTTFPRVAVDNDDIFRVSEKKLLHGLDQVEKHMKWRRVVILPIESGHSSIETFWFVLLFRAIEDAIFFSVTLFKKTFDLCFY